MYQLQGEKKDNVINPKLKMDDNHHREMIFWIMVDGGYFFDCWFSPHVSTPYKQGRRGGGISKFLFYLNI